MKKEFHNGRPSMGPGEVMMFLAGVLFCLLLITTAMMGGLFARYSTSGTGKDSARVIRFGDITIVEKGDFSGDSNQLPITPGVDIEKKAVVNFEGSEAATYVFLEVSLQGSWTEQDGVFSNSGKLSWQIADGWERLENRVYYRELEPNETLSADIIKDGVIKVSVGSSDPSFDGLTSSISFRASVVQSHGFDSVTAAWASLQSKGAS